MNNFLLLILIILNFAPLVAQETTTLKEGDIIFQTSKSSLSIPIQLATQSKYSHVGIVFFINNKWVVLEASYKTKLTPIEQFIGQGLDSVFVVKRLKLDYVFSVDSLKNAGSAYLNKDYDIKFSWSDDKMYCSELVYKVYKQSSKYEIGKQELFKSFNLKDERVRKKIEEIHGKNIPYEEVVISPQSIFEDADLEEVMKAKGIKSLSLH